MKPLFIKAIFVPKKGLFELTIEKWHISLPPSQFFSMVKYLGEVAISYQNSWNMRRKDG